MAAIVRDPVARDGDGTMLAMAAPSGRRAPARRAGGVGLWPYRMSTRGFQVFLRSMTRF
jgi:hypothetical protein